jgi:hypothetical protein
MAMGEEQPKTRQAGDNSSDGNPKPRSRWGFPIPMFTRPVVGALTAVGIAAAFVALRNRGRARGDGD